MWVKISKDCKKIQKVFIPHFSSLIGTQITSQYYSSPLYFLLIIMAQWDRLCWDTMTDLRSLSKLPGQRGDSNQGCPCSNLTLWTLQHSTLLWNSVLHQKYLYFLIRVSECVAVKARQNILAGYHFRNQIFKDFGQCWFKRPSPQRMFIVICEITCFVFLSGWKCTGHRREIVQLSLVRVLLWQGV